MIIKPQISHTVRAEDTLYSIARRYGVSVRTLWQNNPVLGGKSELTPGQQLKIKLPLPTGGTIQTGGYAYTNIDPDVLRQTLPYLTYLCIFTYGYRDDGTLIPIEDDALIALAKEYGTGPVLHLSSLNENGKFSGEHARALLENRDMQARLITSLVATLEQKGYVGVDVDFELLCLQASLRTASFRFSARLIGYHTLNLNRITSPSFTTYSLPSRPTGPFSLAAA